MRGNGCEKNDCEYLKHGIRCRHPRDTVDINNGYPICPYSQKAIDRSDYNGRAGKAT